MFVLISRSAYACLTSVRLLSVGQRGCAVLAMQNVVRPDSRVRRGPSSDSLRPARAHRLPSSSRIDLNPLPASAPSANMSAITTATAAHTRDSSSTASWYPYVQAICQSLSYFCVFSALHSAQAFHVPLLALPAYLIAFLFFFFAARLPFSIARIFLKRPAARSALITIAVLYLISFATCSYALTYLGLLRALIAFGAYPTLARLVSSLCATSPSRHPIFFTQPLALAPLFFTTLAFVLLAHDATGGRIPPSHAAHVRDRVLRNPTARLVHEKFQKLSTRVSNSLQNQTLSSYRIPMYANRQTRRWQRVRSGQRKLNTRDTDSQHNAGPRPMSDLDPPRRRRLLSIIKGDQNNTLNDSNPLTVTNSEKPPSSQHLRQPTLNSSHLTNSSSTSKDIPASESQRDITQNQSSTDLKQLNGLRRNDHLNVSNNGVLQLPAMSAVVALLFAVLSPLANQLASDYTDRLVADQCDALSIISLAFCFCTLSLLVYYVCFAFYINLSGHTSSGLSPDLFWKGVVTGACFFIIPISLRCYTTGVWRRNKHPVRPHKGVAFSFPRLSLSMFNIGTASPPVLVTYLVALVSLLLWRVTGITSFPRAESLSFFSTSSAILLVLVSRMERMQLRSRVRRDTAFNRQRSSGTYTDLSVFMTKRGALYLRHRVRSLWETTMVFVRVIRDLSVHARSNRASWQVLNFLVLQSGMAVTELIYASATHTTGLFSISADNFFCSIALAVGLFAIRMSSRKASLMYSYGYSRVESVCGFANGIMLIYVAMLIVLESLDRVTIQGRTAFGRAFSVCLFGIIGNGLGLYFFPPETRRENHNVQGIYLHILANTLAFASVAVSATTTALSPEWQTVDVVMATIVACGVVAFAIPLIARSGCLLLLMVSNERRSTLQSVEERLASIPGVRQCSRLRIWNLTPSSLVASVKLEIEKDNDNLHYEVLSNARSIFAMMGIPASQCTIQVSCPGTDEIVSNGAIFCPVDESEKGV